MVEMDEAALQQPADVLLVVNAKGVEQAVRLLARRGDRSGFGDTPAQRERKPDVRPFAGRTFNVNGSSVALHHAIHHRESQPGAATVRFGGEKRFQTTLA